MTQIPDLLDAITLYAEALHEGDADKLMRVFHPQSSLFDADQGRIFVEPIDSFCRDVATRPAPAAAGQALQSEVLMLDFLSPRCAVARLRIRLHQNLFIDHLSFAKGEEGWQIVAKTWHLERVLAG